MTMGPTSMQASRAFLALRPLLLAAGVVAAMGCGGSKAAPSDGGAGQTGAAGSGAGGGAGQTGTGGETGGGGGAGGQTACGPRGTYGGGETSMSGASVTAKIVDETGAPVAGQPIYICGIDICSSPGVTGSDGSASIQTNLTIKRAAFKAGDSVTYSELAIPLTTAATDFTTGGHALALAKLSDKPGTTLTPGTSVTSGDVTVTLPAGGQVEINTLVYATTDNQKLRAVAIPLANSGPVLPTMVGGAPADFALLYGVAPADTLLCPAAKVTVALPHKTTAAYNDLGWTPGTAVEFWITTVDVGQLFAPYAGWAKMSDGVVSADGSNVATLDGAQGGFVVLENFAIRKAP